MRHQTFCFVALSLGVAATTRAALVVTGRDDLTGASATVNREDPNDFTVFVQNDVFGDVDSFHDVTPASHLTSSSASGTLNDTATNATLVASGSGSASVTSTLNYGGPGGSLNSYALAGSYAASYHTGTLAGYRPGEVAANNVVVFRPGTVYNSSLSLLTSVAVPFSVSVGQTNSVGTVFNAARVYRDTNNDGIQDAGDDVIVDYFVVSGNGSATMTGTLTPSASNYLIGFFGNTLDGIETDNTSGTSSANFTGSFTVIPEPTTALAAAAAAGLGAVRARRAR